jgi:xylan 1,4-beta-xylosidase
MRQQILALPNVDVHVDGAGAQGPLEWWRHTLGHGGINATPLPARVVNGVGKLQPRLIRIFLQEFFAVYPDHGRFDWERLDPYMRALAETGAKVVADISIKPRALYPRIDQTVWKPTDVAGWQRLIFELVQRYSVEKPIVTHWEIGNETDIGEDGGAPYLIPDPEAYTEFYRMTTRPILEAFPAARVGGPAACWVENEPLPGFVARCRDAGIPLHFISWHLYSNDPLRHASGVEKAKALLTGFPGPRPEMMVTEWSSGFDRVSVEELAFDSQRAAITAASILAMMEAGLDWSFYYHLWDQVCYPEQFQPFFSEKGVANMVTHWNEVPHRFGLFGVGEEVRPQYFVYGMLSRLGAERIAAQCEEPGVRVLAARGEGALSVLLVNFTLEESRERVVTVRFSHLQPGRKILTVCRIDAERRWSSRDLELLPTERREVAAPAEFRCQVLCPADSVTLLTLEDREP